MSSSSFRDLRVWQEAMKLTAEVYRGTIGFPRHELYGVSSKCDGLRSLCRVILRKGKATTPIRVLAFSISCAGIALGIADSAFDR
jgi:hypothetical protein